MMRLFRVQHPDKLDNPCWYLCVSPSRAREMYRQDHDYYDAEEMQAVIVLEWRLDEERRLPTDFYGRHEQP